MDRRRETRRIADLVQPRWHRLAVVGLAALAGVGVALEWSAPRAEPPRRPPVSSVHVEREMTVDSALRDELATIRDEAEALTPTGVLLDERVREHWLLEVERLSPLLDDPELPTELRSELDAILAALRRASVLT